MSDTAASATPVSGLAPDSPGITPPSNPNRHGAFLTDVIVELGFAGRAEVDAAVDAARRLAKTPEGYLLETGAIDERQFSIALAERNGLDHVDLDQFQMDMDAAGLIDKPIAARYSAVPIAFTADGALLVAIEDPCDVLGVSDIEVMTRNDVRPVIAMGSQIQALVERLPDHKPRSAADGQQPLAPDAEAEVPPDAGAEVGPKAPSDAGPKTPSDARPEARGEPPTEGSEPVEAQTPPQAGPEAPPVGRPNPPALVAVPEPAALSGTDQPVGDDDVELGELSAALKALGDRMREAGDLARTAERRIGELEEADVHAQEAAAALDDERAEFERELKARAERERQLDADLKAARERIAELEGRQAELTGAAELAKAAAEQLSELQRVLSE